MSGTPPPLPEFVVNGIDHIDMAVESVEEAAAFYVKLGFEILRRTEHVGGAIELRFPGEGDQPVLELVPCTKPDGTRLAEPGVRHIGLRCSDVHAAYRTLGANGVSFRKEPGYYGVTRRWLLNAIDPSAPMMQFVGTESATEEQNPKGGSAL